MYKKPSKDSSFNLDLFFSGNRVMKLRKKTRYYNDDEVDALKTDFNC